MNIKKHSTSKSTKTDAVANRFQSRARQACLELIDDDSELAFIDGHDNAIIGVVERDGLWMVVYDTRKILQLLRKRDGMSREGAREFFEYNIASFGIGENMPIFVSCFK